MTPEDLKTLQAQIEKYICRPNNVPVEAMFEALLDLNGNSEETDEGRKEARNVGSVRGCCTNG